MVSKRLNWIDWMKAIGMYLIVLGHLTAIGYEYIYVFSVPLFFLISGFLCHKETNAKIFWKKLVYNLMIPMIILGIAMFVMVSASQLLKGTFDIHDLYSFPVRFAIGCSWTLGSLWFVYTLVVLKVIYQFLDTNKFASIMLFIMLPLLGILINNAVPTVNGINFWGDPNAIVNSTTAWPFFAIGNYLGKWKQQMIKLNNKYIEVLSIIFGVAIVIICERYNGMAQIWQNKYGNSFILFLLGGIGGSVAVFALAKLLDNLSLSIITDISNGAIIILGLHYILISVVHHIIINPVLDLLSGALIVVAFVPVIRLAENHFPLLIGKYRIK